MPLNLSPGNSFIDTLRFGSYLVEARITLFSNGISQNYVVPVSVASITVDRNAAQRRSGTFTAELVPLQATLPDPTEIPLPTSPSSLLTPFGNELFLEYGVFTVGTPVQFAPLGLFTITGVTVDDSTDNLTVTVEIADRSFVISQRAFLQPWVFPKTREGNFVEEMIVLLNYIWNTNQATGEAIPGSPPLVYNIAPTDAVLPSATYDQGSDPWQAAQDMANAIGYELFFGLNGEVVGYPIPNPLTQPITWNFTDDTQNILFTPSRTLEGSPFSTPIEISVAFTRQGIFNDIFITGTGTSNAPYSNTGNYEPVIAEAKDTNPGSSTYVYGPLGDLPEFVASNLAVSGPQAQAIANNDLTNATSSAWQFTLTASPNPLFDVDDVITITRPRVGLNNALGVIDQISHVISYDDALQISGRIVAQSVP